MNRLLTALGTLAAIGCELGMMVREWWREGRWLKQLDQSRQERS